MNIAILIPCFNEEKTIFKVISDIKSIVSLAEVYMFDNNSNDNTIKEARRAGAHVITEKLQGKGHVVRRMFREVKADIYVMVDGDDTYDVSSLPSMIQSLVDERLDMVVGVRSAISKDAYRIGHAFGNKMFNYLLSILFGKKFSDIFSGYRVFSRRFVDSFPCHASGFEVETELSVHALMMNLPTKEVETLYSERPEGSYSKLSTYKDGLKILITMFKLLKEVRPFTFFSFIALFLVFVGTMFFIPILSEYYITGLVPKIPTLVVTMGIYVSALSSFLCGVLLHSVGLSRIEMKYLQYLRCAHVKEEL